MTVVATSAMVGKACDAASALQHDGVSVEVIDLVSLKPWDRDCVLESVRKTGRLLVIDEAWKTCGFAAEVAATIADQGFNSLRAPVKRLGLPDVPAPTSSRQEEAYYISTSAITSEIEGLVRNSLQAAA